MGGLIRICVFAIRKSAWALVGTAVPMSTQTQTRGKQVCALLLRPPGRPMCLPCSGCLRLPAPVVGPALARGGDGGLSRFTGVETDVQRGPGTGSGPPACPVWSQEGWTLLSPLRPHLPFLLPGDQTSSRRSRVTPSPQRWRRPSKQGARPASWALGTRPGPQHRPRVPCGGVQGDTGMLPPSLCS